MPKLWDGVVMAAMPYAACLDLSVHTGEHVVADGLACSVGLTPAQGRSDGGISVYIPPKSVYLKFFIWLFSLLDPFIPTQIKFLATPLQRQRIGGFRALFIVYIFIGVHALRLISRTGKRV